jgi:NADH:ubiquinone oxidoreductase subunit K
MGKKELCLSQKSVLKILSGQVTKLFIIEFSAAEGLIILQPLL